MSSMTLSISSNQIRKRHDEMLLWFHERESILFSALGQSAWSGDGGEAKQTFWDSYTSMDVPTRFVLVSHDLDVAVFQVSSPDALPLLMRIAAP